VGESVVILAAGVGSRLRPLTDRVPKSLLHVGSCTILEWQLDALAKAGYNRSTVHVVAGHGHEHFSPAVLGSAKLLVFREYQSVNNVGTLAFALSEVPPPVVLVNADTLFSAEHLVRLRAAPGDSALLYDPTRPPRPEAMKIRIADSRLAGIAKSLAPESAHGEYIGLARLGTAAHEPVRAACDRLVAERPESWYEDALAEICTTIRFTCLSIGELPWIEIDDHDDLARAVWLVKEGRLASRL
jgi:choline kinase